MVGFYLGEKCFGFNNKRCSSNQNTFHINKNDPHIIKFSWKYVWGNLIQSTLVISKSKGLSEILRVIRTSSYQIWRMGEINKSNSHI